VVKTVKRGTHDYVFPNRGTYLLYIRDAFLKETKH